MAFGIKQAVVAIPQPGTSNLPYPAGNLPPFVPVTFSVIDNYAAAIETAKIKQVALIAGLATAITGLPGTPATLSAIDADLSALSKSLNRIADNKKALADMLVDLNVAVNAMVVSKTAENSNLAASAMNRINSNNFYMVASTDQPVMPPVKDQIKQSLKDAATFSTSAVGLGFINKTMSAATQGITGYVTSTEIYKTVASKLSSLKQSVLSVFAPSASSIKESAQVMTGVKGP